MCFNVSEYFMQIHSIVQGLRAHGLYHVILTIDEQTLYTSIGPSINEIV